MASFAEKIAEISKAAREKNPKAESTQEWREQKKNEDITKFFEAFIAKSAKDKIEARAAEGCLSSNIYEYHFSAYFYIDKKNEVQILPEFKKDAGFYMHRIHHTVHSEFFQIKLKELVSSFGGNMQFDSWYPGREKINVITVFWGPTKTHKFPLIWGESPEDEEIEEELSEVHSVSGDTAMNYMMALKTSDKK
jgi:hypothetical protein